MRTLALLAGLLISTSAFSETYLTVPFASYHLDRHRGYNEQNTGLGLEHALTENWRLAAGTFRNSLRRDSNYAGVIYAPLKLGPVRIGSSLGVISGYGPKPLPMLGPTLMIEGKQYGLNVVIIPPMDHGKAKSSGVLGFQFKWRLD